MPGPVRWRPGRASDAIWPLIAAAAAVVPFAGGFSTTRVFFIRDLGMYFWPRHLWLWHTVRDGEWPWWDPYAGAGQAAVADALNQLFLLPVTVARLLAPPVIGFNLWIAAPFPLMAVGAWLWLRRHASVPGAFVGAAFCCISGPVLSTGNFPNFSWAIAAVPWILWAIDRVHERRTGWRFAVAAGAVACQALAGEPVTCAATGVLVVTYASMAMPAMTARHRAERAAWSTGALACGALLAAVQLVPLLRAAMASPRAAAIDSTFWSLHPVSIAEMVFPQVFGDPYSAPLESFPWIPALNSGREPLLFSLYTGIGVWALALCGSAAEPQRSWRRFWMAAAGAGLLLALGDYTPVYPGLQAAVPALQALRFPVKYMVVLVIALAALAATGVDALRRHARDPMPACQPAPAAALIGLLTAGAAALAIATFAWPDAVAEGGEKVARWAGVEHPDAAARWLIAPVMSSSLRAAALGAAVMLLLGIAWKRHQSASLAIWLLAGLAVADPLVVNSHLHPTMGADALGPPAWLEAIQRDTDRVYVGGRVRRPSEPGTPDVRPDLRSTPGLVDAPDAFPMAASAPFHEAVTAVSAQFAYTPAAWGIREVISYDLPQLWPREYQMMLRRFRHATREERLRFLGRVGVRYCFLPEPPYPGAAPVTAPLELTRPMALYECATPLPRVYVTEAAIVEPDLARHLDLMFDPSHDPSRRVVLEHVPPAPAGIRRLTAAAASGAWIVRGNASELVVGAAVGPIGGYLNVLDTFDPDWAVVVDGSPAPLLRANGNFRAIRLAPGAHTVKLWYRPRAFYAGAAVSATTALGTILFCWVVRPREPFARPTSGGPAGIDTLSTGP